MADLLDSIMVKGLDLPVAETLGHETDGVAIGHRDGEVFIVLTRNGHAVYIRVSGNALDTFCELLGDAISAATRFEHPSLERVQ